MLRRDTLPSTAARKSEQSTTPRKDGRGGQAKIDKQEEEPKYSSN